MSLALAASCTVRIELRGADAGSARDARAEDASAVPAPRDGGLDAEVRDGGCLPSLALCEGECVDLRTDPENCGACGVACPPDMNARPVCVAPGLCGAICEDGFDDCSALEPGCEQALDVREHCGACDRSCDWSCRGGGCDDAVAIATGRAHACVLREGGDVACWGDNDAGQLGDGTRVSSATPVRALLASASAIAAGGELTCALLLEGPVCWGRNDHGQLGDGTAVDRATPAPVLGLDGSTKALAVGGAHACALRADGEVVCWGSNEAGQIGDGTTIDRYTPRPVSTIDEPAVALAAGDAHTCALLESGLVRCWGASPPSPRFPRSPGTLAPRRALRIAAGARHTCAIVTHDELYCWGENESGQLGDGTTASSAEPVRVAGLVGSPTALALGAAHTCVYSHTSGAVQCWGENGSGQLGDSTFEDRLAPGDPVALDGVFGAIASGAAHACVLLSSSRAARFVAGRPECWGEGASGQLGDGAWIARPTRAEVSPP